ncbi:hypothetical protein [Methanopyrus kandleri]|uniref:FtsZ GTPase involved in cell division n=2 Tax=Methanopyrus kandleri TaxID=2320 RepID=Q8TWB0_METKA|nr:hypothetical protein [Methanopyrus kandleri]AAM02339.1 FtsZ GTPase involved in cell division [Methanopyrus kandleri AV19]HII69760.1 hypothetical protein [Methanopyrus kandleri]
MIVVGAGTFGCRVAPYVASAFEASSVVLVDTPDGIQSGEELAKKLGLQTSRVEVAYGSPSGAHRDYETAMKDAEKSEALKQLSEKFVEVVKLEYRADRVPVLVWGLGGAIGAATAIRLGEEVPYALHVTVLPDYRSEVEPVRRLLFNAKKQLQSFMGRLKRHPVIIGDFAGVPADKVGEHLVCILSRRHEIVDKRRVQTANYVRDGDDEIRMAFLVDVNRYGLQRVQLDRIISQIQEMLEWAEDFVECDLAGRIRAARLEESLRTGIWDNDWKEAS